MKVKIGILVVLAIFVVSCQDLSRNKAKMLIEAENLPEPVTVTVPLFLCVNPVGNAFCKQATGKEMAIYKKLAEAGYLEMIETKSRNRYGTSELHMRPTQKSMPFFRYTRNGRLEFSAITYEAVDEVTGILISDKNSGKASVYFTCKTQPTPLQEYFPDVMPTDTFVCKFNKFDDGWRIASEKDNSFEPLKTEVVGKYSDPSGGASLSLNEDGSFKISSYTMDGLWEGSGVYFYNLVQDDHKKLIEKQFKKFKENNGATIPGAATQYTITLRIPKENWEETLDVIQEGHIIHLLEKRGAYIYYPAMEQ